MNFAQRPSFLREDPGPIARNPVRCNSFELHAADVCVYAVRVAPDVPAQQGAKFRSLLSLARAQLAPLVGDFMLFGTQLVGSKSADAALAKVDLDGCAYEVSLARVAAPDALRLKELFLNNLLNRAQAACRLTQIGRKFFDVSSKTQVDPEQGISVVTGFSSAVHVRLDSDNATQRVFVEVDTTQKVYFDCTVLQTMNRLRERLGERDLRAEILRRFKGRYVITEYDTCKAQRVSDVNFDMTPEHSFTLSAKGGEAREISQRAQLRERHNRDVRELSQPLLVAEVKRGRGSKTDTVQLLPEFCRETGLNDELRAGGFMMKLLRTKLKSDERIRKQGEFLQRVFAQKEVFERQGVRLQTPKPTPLALDGGRIPPGRLSFGAQTHDLARKTMFDREAQGGVFSAPGAFNWAILSLQGDRENVAAKNTFVSEFQKACERAKLQVNAPAMHELPRDAQAWLSAMRSLQGADFLLLVVPARGRKKDDLNLYKLTKRLAISELAVPTQVVLSKTLAGKGVTSIVSKVLTQVVAKLNNGAPWGLVAPECAEVPTMVCGVDVWHGHGKSVMGFTASLDQAFSKQTSDVRAQDMKEELSAEIASCVHGCAEGFRRLNGVQPARIIVQRDGVGEGQFQTVLAQEVGAIQDLLAKHNVPARLLFAVVNKRVDAKLLNAQTDEGCPEGTVVDELITRPRMWDFYMVPLFGRQGLANPVYYSVLHDGTAGSDAPLRPCQLYALTYKLCFMYYNWTGPVRAPAPLMFAHKLAYLLGEISDHDLTVVPQPKLAASVSCWYL